MPGQKLDDNWTHPFPAAAAAYQVCLGVEKELILQQTQTPTATGKKVLEKNLINIRILGYLLMFAPTSAAREHIAKRISAEKDAGSDALIRRGAYYDQLFLRTCKLSSFHGGCERSNLKTFEFVRPTVVRPKSPIIRDRPTESHSPTWRERSRHIPPITQRPRKVQVMAPSPLPFC